MGHLLILSSKLTFARHDLHPECLWQFFTNTRMPQYYLNDVFLKAFLPADEQKFAYFDII